MEQALKRQFPLAEGLEKDINRSLFAHALQNC